MLNKRKPIHKDTVMGPREIAGHLHQISMSTVGVEVKIVWILHSTIRTFVAIWLLKTDAPQRRWDYAPYKVAPKVVM